MNFKYISLSLSVLLFSATVKAQDKPEEKKPEQKQGSITEEIEVVRPYKPVLADAAKIRRSPDLTNYKAFHPQLSYSILDKKLELNSDIKQLQAHALSEPPAVPFRNNYAKLGIGNLGGNLGELYLNTGEDQALQAGFFLKHVAQDGELNKQKVAHQELGIFGKSIQDKITLDGELTYDRLSTYFYGIDRSQPMFNQNPEKQRYSTLNLKGELLKNFEKDNSLDYAAKAELYALSNKTDARETSLAVSGFFNNVWRQFNIGLNGSVDFTYNKDSLDIGNHILRANPYVKFQGKNYKVSVGINLVQEFSSAARTNLLPAVVAELPVVPQYATIFGGYTGDVLKSSLRDFSTINPWVGKVLIQNAVEKSNVYGGVKGNAGAGFGFKGMIYFKKIDNMPLFVNSKASAEKFDVIYDDAKIAGLEGELSIKASEVLTWTGKLEMNSYKMKTQNEAWMKPGFRLYSNARLSISKKFILDGELVLNGDTQALSYLPDPTPVTIKSFVDLSAGAEYAVKNKLGVFVRLNNLFGSQYQQYLYYPKFGFNAFAGVNYSF